ncbi:MAG TPA: discoidin domain-containing protein [Steroidobacteraceae bacterium]
MRRVGLFALMLLCAVGFAADEPAVPPETSVLDPLDDASAWDTAVSENVIASLRSAEGLKGGALVMEFDLANTAGYASARRKLPTELPEDYEISFWMRGEAGRNHLEVKFVDESGFNVWWYRRPNFQVSGDWQQIRIKRRQIEFAWGPTTDKVLRRFASIEFGIGAGVDGGRGSLWFDDLTLKVLPPQKETPRPVVSASSALRGTAPGLAMDSRLDTSWRSERGPQTVQIDLQRVAEFGGLEIDWVTGLHAVRYTIETSLDGTEWQTVRRVTAGNGKRDSHFLPESEARFIRVSMPDADRQYGIAEIHVRDLAFGASPNAFIQAVAKNARRGCYPRGYSGEQTYWTVVGVDSDEEESLVSEDGAVELRRASFSIEPFVKTQSGLVTWADATMQHSLLDGYLPVPIADWKHRDMDLRTTVQSVGRRGQGWTRATYTLKNNRRSKQKLTLALVVRPLQVNPPTQFLNTTGGVSPIWELAWRDGAVNVDQVRSIIPKQPPARFVAVPFDADTPCDWLGRTDLPNEVKDETGLASGALLYDVELEPEASATFVLDLPLHPNSDLTEVSDADAARSLAEWREKLNRVTLRLPKDDQDLFDTLRTSLAHVLINRDGPAIQPGSRSYERSWIRDGAMTSEMLLRLGHEDVVKEFAQWYAGYLFENGKTPCCVDRRGADPVPENDSPGEFLFLIDELHRYTGDTKLLRSLWPRVVKAFEYMESMRQSERTEENLAEDRRVFYGLMPASISHEGYSAKPMHSYWDNFWALQGYESMVRMARVLGETEAMRRAIQLRDEFRADLYRSLQLAQRIHNIDYLPGAAELGDFDATSTTIALSPVGEQQMLPPNAMFATFERYWENFTARRSSSSWDVYTPYEWRLLGTFIRLGWRERGLELIEFFMNDRRPARWNQWAEVVGREERVPRFVGDMPHGWVASDFGRSILDMFAYERPADEALVLMAGVPAAWVRKDGFAVENLRTPYGPLTYSLTVEGGRRTLEVAALKQMPVGGVVVAWPEGQKGLGRQSIQEGSARWTGVELRINRLPFRVMYEAED